MSINHVDKLLSFSSSDAHQRLTLKLTQESMLLIFDLFWSRGLLMLSKKGKKIQKFETWYLFRRIVIIVFLIIFFVIYCVTTIGSTVNLLLLLWYLLLLIDHLFRRWSHLPKQTHVWLDQAKKIQVKTLSLNFFPFLSKMQKLRKLRNLKNSVWKSKYRTNWLKEISIKEGRGGNNAD